MRLYRLNIDQKDLLTGKQYKADSFFNPIQDSKSEWFISIEEVEQCENEELLWIKELLLSDYEPIIYEANE